MKYILSLSYGKDSMAMLHEIIRRKLPLDYVIYCDIRFDDEPLSGEHPLMAEWIPKAKQIIKDKFGIDVIHITSDKTFKSQFYTKKKRGKRQGDNYGFPYTAFRGGWCNDRLKMQPVNKFLRQFDEYTQYIGIAKDEPKRLERYKELETDKIKYVTLADFDITEDEAMEICKENDLLSPKYTNSFRGGCWFCPKQTKNDLYNLWKNYPLKFNQLEEMEKDSFNTFYPNLSLKEIRKMFEDGYIPKRRK